MGIHDGHRQRLRERFIKHGLSDFNELNALELLLFYAIPRRDTNPIAHALLDRFGSLTGVFEASMQELCEVEGVGESAASLILLAPQIMKRAAVADAEKVSRIMKTSDIVTYLRARFMYEPDELFIAMFLDTQRAVIKCEVMARGVVNSVDVNVRRLVETALKCKASTIVLAHNHPDGNCLHSAEDDAVTQIIYRALDLLGIELLDHLIFAGNDVFSYERSGIMSFVKR